MAVTGVFGHTPKAWRDLIAQGKRLARREDDLRWAWADLFLAVTPNDLFPNDGGWNTRRTGGPTIREALSTFRSEVRFEGTVNTMVEHRLSALNWPKEQRVKGASWSAHRALVGHPDRFSLLKPGMSHKEAATIAGRDLTHLRRRINVPDANLSYEDVYGYVRWANNLLRKAGVVSANLSLDYRQRSSLKELMEGTQEALDNTKEIIKTQTGKRKKAA